MRRRRKPRVLRRAHKHLSQKKRNMSSNSTAVDDGNAALLAAISFGGFFGLILLCSFCGISFRCAQYIFKDESTKAEQVQQNPVDIIVDEDPS
jgi:hypothetical protein